MKLGKNLAPELILEFQCFSMKRLKTTRTEWAVYNSIANYINFAMFPDQTNQNLNNPKFKPHVREQFQRLDGARLGQWVGGGEAAHVTTGGLPENGYLAAATAHKAAATGTLPEDGYLAAVAERLWQQHPCRGTRRRRRRRPTTTTTQIATD